MSSPTTSPTSGASGAELVGASSAEAVNDAQLAAWNAIKIVGSLMVTWGVALGIRFVLPRHLGPDLYGAYNFADAFAMTFFVLTALGIDSYVSKEIPVRPAHASEFFAGIVLIRAVLAVLLMGAMAAVLHWTHRPPEIQRLVFVFAVGQFFFVNNATMAALLQAKGTVDGLSVTNVLSKMLWGAGILAAVFSGLGLWPVALAFTVAESLRCASLVNLCRKHLALTFQLDHAATRQVLKRAMPFFVTTLSVTIVTKADVTIMGLLTTDKEVGLYGVASNLAGMGLLMTPVISAVLLPLFCKAAARSEEELNVTVRRSLELVLTFAIPISLALFVGADVWARLVGGGKFAASAHSLRALSPLFVFAYVGIMSGACLNLLRREWTVTAICMVGMIVNPVLNLLLIRPCLAHFGEGGAGIGAALSVIGSETVNCSLMLWVIGRRTIDRRLLSTVGRTLGVCLAVIALDAFLIRLGPWRLIPDALAYIGLALVTRAVRIDEMREFLVQAKANRAGKRAGSAAVSAPT